MTIAIRPATGADLPGLLNSYAEFNPDDPRLPARATETIWADIAAQRGRTPA